MSQNEKNTANPYLLLTKISRLPVLIALILLYLVFVLYIFPNSGYETEVGPLDLKFSYSPQTAYEMIEAYGEEGRIRYARSAMTVDVAYPVVYTLMFIVWLILVLKGTAISEARKRILSLSPLCVFVADMMENTGIIILLKTYPTRHESLVTITSLVTSVKWTAATMVIAITIAGTVHSLWRKFTSR